MSRNNHREKNPKEWKSNETAEAAEAYQNIAEEIETKENGLSKNGFSSQKYPAALLAKEAEKDPPAEVKGGMKMPEEKTTNKYQCQYNPHCASAQNCCECCLVFTDPAKRAKFGVTKEKVSCECHDICIQEVRYIAPIPVDCTFSIPGLADGPRPGCRGERIIISPDHSCELIITCADEQLKPDCSGVDIKIGFQVIFGNIPVGRFLVMDRMLQFSCTSFNKFPEGTPISGHQLRNALKEIDGSQIVADLKCQVLPPDETHPNPRIRVFGMIIEKLWKEENLWISAIRPYSGITIKREFPEPHFIGSCPQESPECNFGDLAS